MRQIILAGKMYTDDNKGKHVVFVGDNPNWCGPQLRHNGRSNNGFADGHVESMKGFWYYTNTPWLDPALGGQ